MGRMMLHEIVLLTINNEDVNDAVEELLPEVDGGAELTSEDMRLFMYYLREHLSTEMLCGITDNDLSSSIGETLRELYKRWKEDANNKTDASGNTEKP